MTRLNAKIRSIVPRISNLRCNPVHVPPRLRGQSLRFKNVLQARSHLSKIFVSSNRTRLVAHINVGCNFTTDIETSMAAETGWQSLLGVGVESSRRDVVCCVRRVDTHDFLDRLVSHEPCKPGSKVVVMLSKQCYSLIALSLVSALGSSWPT